MYPPVPCVGILISIVSAPVSAANKAVSTSFLTSFFIILPPQVVLVVSYDKRGTMPFYHGLSVLPEAKGCKKKILSLII